MSYGQHPYHQSFRQRDGEAWDEEMTELAKEVAADVIRRGVRVVGRMIEEYMIVAGRETVTDRRPLGSAA